MTRTVQEQEIAIYVNSSQVQLNALGNRAQLDISPPIVIPQHARGLIALHSANIPFTSPNISQSLYNNNTLVFSNDSGATQRTISLVDGLYSVTSLNVTLNDYFINNGLPGNLFTLTGDEATGDLLITYNSTTLIIYFNLSTIRSVLGFNSAVRGPFTPTGFTIRSDSNPNFNSLQQYLIQCSICDGSYLNGSTNNILSPVSLTARAGNVIYYQPQNLIYSNVPHRSISRISLALLDQNGNDVGFQSEAFQLVLLLKIVPLLNA